MNRSTLSILLICMVVLGSLIGAVGTVAADDGQDHDTDDANNSSSLSPGQQLSVVFQTQSTDIRTDIENTRFRMELNTSTNRENTANQRATQLQSDIADLREERSTLIEEFRDGNLSKDQFLARLSSLNHALDSKSELAANSEAQARMQGVDADKLTDLRKNAKNLTGGEVSKIARQLAATGQANVTVATDANGNVQFTASDGSPVAVEYKSEGDFTFDLTRDNNSLNIALRTQSGAPVESATIEVNDNDAGTTNAKGVLTLNASNFADADTTELKLKAEKGEAEGELEIETERVPNQNSMKNWGQQFSQLNKDLAQSHKDFHHTWNDRHAQFHENTVNTSQENATQDDIENSDAHEEFHDMMQDAHKDYHKQMRDTRDTHKDKRPDQKPDHEDDDHETPKDTPADEETEDDDQQPTNNSNFNVSSTVTASNTLQIHVLNDGAPVEGATVSVNGDVIGATDARGNASYELTQALLADGEVDVTVVKGEHEVDATVEFNVEQGANTDARK